MFSPRPGQRVARRRLAGLSIRRPSKDKDGREAAEEPAMNRVREPVRWPRFARRGALAILAALVAGPSLALADPVGSVTKLPLPRFASLKTDRVNLREGPSKDHPTKWVYQRAGLPVEITA